MCLCYLFQPQVEGELTFEYAISLEYNPTPSLRERYVHFQSSCLTQLQKHSTQNSCYRIESTVRGHHVYKASWSPYIGEVLPVQREVNSIHDYFAVAVLKNSSTVGHVPREISRVCWYFLHKSGSEMTCSHKFTKDSLYSTHLQCN